MNHQQKLAMWKKLQVALFDVSKALNDMPPEIFEGTHFNDPDTYAGQFSHALPHTLNYVDTIVELTTALNRFEENK